jgi:hypothetical protein
MTPRVLTLPKRATGPSFRLHRPEPLRTMPTEFEQRAFWQWATSPPGFGDSHQSLTEEEHRVLSKAASGGGFLVPTDVGKMITAAARAASAVAQVAQEIVTDQGETFGMALAGTHGTAAWVAESGSYTPSDETITQQNMGAFKGPRARRLPLVRAGRTPRGPARDGLLCGRRQRQAVGPGTRLEPVHRR